MMFEVRDLALGSIAEQMIIPQEYSIVYKAEKIFLLVDRTGSLMLEKTQLKPCLVGQEIQ